MTSPPVIAPHKTQLGNKHVRLYYEREQPEHYLEGCDDGY